VAYALIYAYAPDLEPRRLRWISPGAVTGVGIWIVASIGFGIYIRHFSTYGAAYGAAGAVIVLLLWLWLSSCAFLFGAELNAELERAGKAGRGGPPAVTPAPR
jgi:membrane protein